MNKVILKGRMVDTPQSAILSQNSEVLNFTLAVSRKHRKNGESDTDFIRCKAWNGTANLIEKYFSQGDSIIIVGELRNGKYTASGGEDKYYTYVNVDEIDFAEKKRQ